MRKNLLNGKLMETKLKYGWTTENFTEYLECSEEEFLKTLKKTFSSKAAKDMLNRLEDNKRQKNKGRGSSFGTKCLRNKKDKRTSNSEEISVTVEAALANLSCAEKEEIIEEEKDMLNEETEIIHSAITVEDILAELSVKEKQIRQEICSEEATKVHLIQERRSVNIQLLKQKEEMLRLRSKIKKIQSEVDELIIKGNDITNSIQNVNAELEYNHALLESFQKEIADLNKVTILVYENGEVEFEGPVEFTISDDWLPIFEKITTEDDAEELTIKQIKQLAKVISFVKTLNRPLEVVFDNQVLQKLFDKSVIAA